MDVVLADDTELMRHLLEVAIGACGHTVTAVGDGGAAVAAFERLRPPFVVLDWQMPEVDGVEACRRIRALPGGADAFVLLVTAGSAEGALDDALAAGFDDFVIKPAPVPQIQSRIRVAERRIAQNAHRRRADAALALRHEIAPPLAALLREAEALQPAGSILAHGRQIASVATRLDELAAACTGG